MQPLSDDDLRRWSDSRSLASPPGTAAAVAVDEALALGFDDRAKVFAIAERLLTLEVRGA